MGRPRRQIYSHHVYEICMRTRKGLPFVCTRYMKLLIEGIIARVQRDQKVILCHYLWMGNHPHIIVIARDKKAATQFYGEIQKQLTEAIKRLLGLKHLNLWKNNATSVIPYFDVDTVCYRIAYLYANPARANLVDTISEYPGCSSYNEFTREKSSLDVEHKRECPWVRAPMVEELPASRGVTRVEDGEISRRLEKLAKNESHELIVSPNLWMKCFGIESPEDVEETNKRVVKFLTGLEQVAREERVKKKKKVMGRKQLVLEPVNMTYESDKPQRRIFVYSLDKKLREYLIKQYEKFCELCRECYERWKVGDYSVVWPEGALFPPVPSRQSDFSPEMPHVY